MNAVRKLILKRFLNRNICFLRHANSRFHMVEERLDLKVLASHVPNPEWWMLDEAKYNRLKKLLGETPREVGLLECGFRPQFFKRKNMNEEMLTPTATPGVYFHNVLGDAVPLHVVRFEHEGQDWLFLPLHHPVIQKENAA